jgi:glutamyl-Q tRNA(Asp) synthetase
MSYIGRFAPTPSGDLHFGSLSAAVASYLDAKANEGSWLVRIEDLDTLRVAAGSVDSILSCLETFGLHWDGRVIYQSQRQDAYEEALSKLQQQGHTYRCSCTRSKFKTNPQYKCPCATYRVSADQTSVRVRLPHQNITISDVIMADQTQNMALEVGDFVVRRKDLIYAYQLAVVVDDAHQKVSHVVRGSDLYDQTPRQVWLQSCLGFQTPSYSHLPIITNRQGQKLSKQNLAAALDVSQAPRLLSEVLERLGQNLPHTLHAAPVQEQLAYAAKHWNIQQIPKLMQDPIAFV